MASRDTGHLLQNPTVIRELSRPYYNPRLPYHNFGHAIDVHRAAHATALDALDHGADINFIALSGMAYLHDPEQDKRPGIDHSYATREENAASIARYIFANILRAPEELVVEVSDGILSSAYQAKITTDTQLAFFRGDMDNTQQDKLICLSSSYRLFEEKHYLEGGFVPDLSNSQSRLMREFTHFIVNQAPILEVILSKDRPFGEWEADSKGRSPFTVKARKNLELMTAKNLGLILPDIMPQIQTLAARPLAA